MAHLLKLKTSNKWNYEILSGDEILVKGALIAKCLKEAMKLVMAKIPKRTKGLVVKINDEIVLKDTKLFEPPVVKKLQTRPDKLW